MSHNLFHHLCVALKTLMVGLVMIAIWLLVLLAGLFFWTQFPSPVNLLLGAPLALIGLTMGLTNLYEMVVALVSWRWGRTHCPFCPNSQEPEEILSSQDAFEDNP